MGAPTWPPTPEDAHKATLAEYGDDARAHLGNLQEDASGVLANVEIEGLVFGSEPSGLGQLPLEACKGNFRRRRMAIYITVQ